MILVKETEVERIDQLNGNDPTVRSLSLKGVRQDGSSKLSPDWIEKASEAVARLVNENEVPGHIPMDIYVAGGLSQKENFGDLQRKIREVTGLRLEIAPASLSKAKKKAA